MISTFSLLAFILLLSFIITEVSPLRSTTVTVPATAPPIPATAPPIPKDEIPCLDTASISTLFPVKLEFPIVTFASLSTILVSDEAPTPAPVPAIAAVVTKPELLV